MNYEPTNQKLSLAHRLISQKAGIVEFFLGIIVLFLVLATLNYFNILKISSAFPDQLGWLPHQQTQKKTVVPSPANFTQATFQYDTKKAETMLTQYIKDTVKPELLPANIKIEQNEPTNKSQGIPYLFESSFSINKVIVSANLYYKKETSTPSVFIVFVNLKNIDQVAVTASLTNSLLSQFFTNPYTISNCKTEDYMSYCENFQTLIDGKRGYGVFKTTTSINPSLISCFIPKGSEYYKLESCTKL